MRHTIPETDRIPHQNADPGDVLHRRIEALDNRQIDALWHVVYERWAKPVLSHVCPGLCRPHRHEVSPTAADAGGGVEAGE